MQRPPGPWEGLAPLCSGNALIGFQLLAFRPLGSGPQDVPLSLPSGSLEVRGLLSEHLYFLQLRRWPSGFITQLHLQGFLAPNWNYLGNT